MAKTLRELAKIAKIRRQARTLQGLCSVCTNPAKIGRKLCEKHGDNSRNRSRRFLKREYIDLKSEVFTHYGNICKCCGFTGNPKFLTIDHINNDGAKHRKEIGHSTTALLRWLKKNNYPTDNFQLLCWNCNMGKARNGGICPHKEAPHASQTTPNASRLLTPTISFSDALYSLNSSLQGMAA